MSLVIYKYTLESKEVQRLKMPSGAEILTVQTQVGSDGRNRVCLWALVNPDRPESEYEYGMYGTGNPIPDDYPGHYISTIQIHGLLGPLVFHIFARGNLLSGEIDS